MTLSMENYCTRLAESARKASREVRKMNNSRRRSFLNKLAQLISDSKKKILSANSKDLAEGRKMGLSNAMLDRLALDEKRLRSMAKGVREIAALPDPCGRIISSHIRKDNLEIQRISVPIGSIFFIFESRPNVAVDGAALCLKSGNAVILRGGKESASSNRALVQIIRKALRETGITPNAVQLVNRADYRVVNLLLCDMKNIDLAIPRGGEKLIRTVAENSRIPVIKHYKGVCHIYLDRTADMGSASDIILNAKIQRPGVCNAMETLLLDKKADTNRIISILNRLRDHEVELIGCSSTRRIMPGIRKAADKDWDEEYLDLRLSVRIVDGVSGAVEHIRKHGSGHTEAVMAKSKKVQREFIENVDSSSVMVNCSTRFSDGGEYGLGAEVGISTDKLHARGPMGIESLTTYQWRVVGDGHVRV